jgi:predicted O-linked N-acetylglucosamine transferase (SPINDLY family)
MGNLQLKQYVVRDDAPCSSASDGDISAWLDGFITALESGLGYACDAAADACLRTASFELLLAAIERARPGPAMPAEIALYRKWIEQNDPHSPLLHLAWFNLGTLLGRSGDQTGAAIAYRKALDRRADMHGAAINLGLLLEAAGHPDEALGVWKGATQPDEQRVMLGIQQGRLLEKMGRFADAETALRRVLLTDPAQPDVVHHWVHLRQKTCLWPVTPGDIPGLSSEQLLQGSGPLGILALTDDIGVQSQAAAGWVARKTTPAPIRLAPERPYPHQRIRIGYLSSDFCSHAMSYLITELFERHDRGRFEVFGYCASPDDGSPVRQRVLAAFDHRRFVRALSDESAARMIRDDEIDVLVELNGITDGSRLAVLRWRPAPIQATYLGFIGALPLPELDYLLCDRMVIPPEHEVAYHPKPLPIARIFQANDSKRAIGNPLTRAECGLPEDAFVLCCFSKHYKITETMFGAWMEIMRRAERTVLWLAVDNEYSEANLRAAAARAGIADQRLIIAERAPPDLYMSRLRLADLFLDTFPYNAGTIASDAVRMGLPLLTLCGEAFASRMAASLLYAIDAARGITTTLPRYIETAVELATDPAAHASYKARFTADAWARGPGNIGQWTREFEETLIGIVDAARAA